MARQPIVGGDNNSWGAVLDSYMSVSLNSDGTINPSALTTAGVFIGSGTGITVSGSPSAGQVLTALTSSTAAWQSPATSGVSVSWINVSAPPYNADKTGVVDAAPAINNAITAAVASGNPVYLPTGIYLIKTPIVISQSGVTIVGDHGATSSGDDAGNFLGTVIKVSNLFTNVAFAAFGTGAILVLDGNPGTGTTPTKGTRIFNLWVDGTSAPANVDGLTFFGPINSIGLMNVGVFKATGHGFNFASDNGTGPDGMHLYNCLAQTCVQDGFHGKMTDGALVDCHAQSCGQNGIFNTGGNTRFIGCRADLCGQDGWKLDHGSGADGYDDGILLSGCGTQRNNHNGCRITNSSSTGTTFRNPVFISNCSFGEDGQNGTWQTGGGITSAIGGGGFAGILVEGQNIVSINNSFCGVGTVDVAGGCPQYGIATATIGSSNAAPGYITISGSRLEGVTALINDAAAVQGSFKISPETVGGIGYQPASQIFRSGTATLVAGTVTVSNAWATASCRIILTPISATAPAGFPYVSSRSAGSFTIKSTSAADTYSVQWHITSQ